MVRLFSVFNTATLICLLAPMAVYAQKLAPLPDTLAYSFSYLELPIGTMTLKVSQAPNLSIDGNIQVSGVARLFSDHHNDMSLRVMGPNPRGHARNFTTRYASKGREEKLIELGYDADGTLVSAERKNIYDMDRRGLISDAQHQAALDPLSMIIGLRQRVFDAIATQKTAFSATMYDGKRLHGMDVRIYGTRPFEWQGRMINVRKIGLSRRLIAGQTAKEIKKYGSYQLPEAVIYFSDDLYFIPVYAKQSWKFGAFKATLQ